jgi:hypothetical protein
MKPPRLTASPKTRSTGLSTTSLLPAATAHNAPAAASLPRRVVAARSLARMWPLARITTSSAPLRSAAVRSERVKLSLMTDGRYSMARLRTTT